MLPRTYDMDCSIARSLEVIGDRWTLLIIRNALRGVTRFDDHQRDLQIAPNVLTDRLSRLTEDGILERQQYQERPPRYEYHPTDKGLALWPVLAAMVEWGDRYYAPDGPPGLLLHSACGTRIVQHLECEHCQTALDPTEIVSAPGPGAAAA